MTSFFQKTLRTATTLLLGLGAWSAASAQVTPPPATVCNAVTVPTVHGTVPGFPGRWVNPDRQGLGWDFFYGDGQQSMYLTWFTYNRAGRPVWLHGEAKDLQFNVVSGERTWASTLNWVEFNPNGRRTVTKVGDIAITFPANTTTRAAVRWLWNRGVNKVDDVVHDECLVDMFRDIASRGTQPNQAFSSNWFFRTDNDNDPRLGWGVDFIFHKLADTANYVEIAAAAIFDQANQPVWLQSIDLAGNLPPATTLNQLPTSQYGVLKYLHYTYTGNNQASVHPILRTCVENCTTQIDDGLSPNPENAAQPLRRNFVERQMEAARAGLARVIASVPASRTGTAAIAWPPAVLGSEPVSVVRVDADHIIVDRSVCKVPKVGDTCEFRVSWSSEDENAVISRVDLVRGGVTRIATGHWGERTEVLKAGDRVQYRINYKTAVLTGEHYTPEVRVIVGGDFPDEAEIVQNACSDKPECDLGTHDASVGATAGEAGVDGGAATYTIPITVPPGRKGMQPSVSLSYSSRAGNGIAGIGWSVSGSSSIHRCPRTLDQDNDVGGVKLDAYDALCLDGQRLVKINGTYGQPGTTYRTEIDSFVRVTQTGNALNSGNVCFKVEHKDGRTSYYGCKFDNTDGCNRGVAPRVVPVEVTPGAPPQTKELSWLIARVEDRTDNRMDYCYTAGARGETLLEAVKYTGSNHDGPGDRVVRFSYEPRPIDNGANDRSYSYVAGFLTQQTQRLTQIQTEAPNFDGVAKPVRTYTLRYDNELQSDRSASSGRSLLRSVQECAFGFDNVDKDGNDAETMACHEPTVFDWADSGLNFRSGPMTELTLPDAAPTGGSDEGPAHAVRSVAIKADYNGDGVREVMFSQRQSDGQLHHYLAQFDADRRTRDLVELSSSSFKNRAVDALSASRAADFDGDGKSEELTDYTLQKWKLEPGAPLTGDPFATVSTNLPAYDNPYIGDFNGDGAPDILALANRTCTPSAPGTVYTDGTFYTVCLFLNPRPADVFPLSNGRIDFTPHRIIELPHATGSAQRLVHITDFDGNGLTDFFVGPSGPETVYLASRSGSSVTFTPKRATDLNFQHQSNDIVHWIDINGDGLDDMVRAHPETCPTNQSCYGNWHIQLNRGGYFANTATPNYPGQPGAPGLIRSGRTMRYANAVRPADIDSDGRADLLYPAKFAARMCVHTMTQCRQDDCPDTRRVWACPEYPPEEGAHPNDLSNLQQAVAGFSYHNSSGVEYLYAKEHEGSDHSIYQFNAVKFVQTGENSFDAVVTQTPLLGKIFSLGRDTDRAVDDLFGDGMTDLLNNDFYCPVRPAPGTLYDRAACAVIGAIQPFPNAPTYQVGPTAPLPGGVPLACLAQFAYGLPTPAKNACDVARATYLNENLGDHERSRADGQRLAPAFPEVIDRATDALGNQSVWEYFPLTSQAGRLSQVPPLYTLGTDGYVGRDRRHFQFRSSMPVVSQLSQSNGQKTGTSNDLLGFRSRLFSYQDALYNAYGRGFQGFRRIIEQQATALGDANRRLRTATTYHQKFPLAGRVEKVETGIPLSATAMQPVSETTYDWRCKIAGAARCATETGAHRKTIPSCSRNPRRHTPVPASRCAGFRKFISTG
ncbi:FG-GAP-like repeat-containing protein [Tahibacter amnicola]|uniref:FG-GAP-like repeat-containing protein n=1 Tax=Tahibacter amnicola TaxID=2976241 RepID=A0ABY6BFH4_9GAMM|nr:FG-GAP-like repeat-containing protein [Tahibacter amnicola]UXI68537.1 FG-GAP-like repeat-containing protein [Tahibacter amnicola]